jgi:HSP20 family protein
MKHHGCFPVTTEGTWSRSCRVRSIGSSAISTTDSNSGTSDWSLAVDVREYSDRFQLLFDVPGVEPKEVEITLDHGVLSVAGNRTEENAAPGAKSGEPAQRQRNERPLGRFHRRFILPDTADAENVQASGRHGVLEIVIPKQWLGSSGGPNRSAADVKTDYCR